MEHASTPTAPPTSLLIPAYNAASTLKATLESVLALPEHRGLTGVYLADDGSTDNTLAVARTTWRSSTPLTVLASERNRGERANVNQALREVAARAAWCFILHADDLAKADWLKLTLDRIAACPTDVATICSSWDDLFPDGRVAPGEDAEDAYRYYAGNLEAVASTLRQGCWWHISGCAIRLAAFEAIGAFTEDLPQQGDWEWLLRCLKAGWGVEYIPRTLIRYRRHAASVSSKSFKEHRDLKETLRIARQFWADAPEEIFAGVYARTRQAAWRRMLRSLSRLDFTRLHGAWAVLRQIRAERLLYQESRRTHGAAP